MVTQQQLLLKEKFEKFEQNISKMAQRSHQYFSLRWNNYQNTMTSVFQQLREDLSFVDVTLSCEHGSLKAHKVCPLIFMRRKAVKKKTRSVNKYFL